MLHKKQQPQENLPTGSEEEVHSEDIAAGTSQTPLPTKKRYRPSKKDIPDYPFSEDQILEIAEFIKQHPTIYDKRDRQWCNPKMKLALWKELAETFPECTYEQVRKFFENKRTDFGKIEKKENKRGALARERTAREQIIMDTWSFLRGHIAHETTLLSDTFSHSKLSPAIQHDDESLSGLSASSLMKRRKRRSSASSVVSPRRAEQTLAENAMKEFLNKPKVLQQKSEPQGYEAELQQFCSFLCTKLRRVSPVNFSMLSGKILELVTCMEEPPEGTTKIENPKRILDSFGFGPLTSLAAQQGFGPSTSSAATGAVQLDQRGRHPRANKEGREEATTKINEKPVQLPSSATGFKVNCDEGTSIDIKGREGTETKIDKNPVQLPSPATGFKVNCDEGTSIDIKGKEEAATKIKKPKPLASPATEFKDYSDEDDFEYEEFVDDIEIKEEPIEPSPEVDLITTPTPTPSCTSSDREYTENLLDIKNLTDQGPAKKRKLCNSECVQNMDLDSKVETLISEVKILKKMVSAQNKKMDNFMEIIAESLTKLANKGSNL